MEQRNDQQQHDKGDYAGQQQAGGQYGEAGQQQGEKSQAVGREWDRQGAEGPAGDDDTLRQGQSSAAEAGYGQGDTMTQQNLGSDQSTAAQRSGGQADGGAGADDSSFAGSSFAGQEGGGGAIIGGAQQPDTSAEYVRSDHGEDDEESELDGQ